jgi:hypothetical protein
VSEFDQPRAQHYVFAHRIIPQVFFGDPAGFMTLFARDGDRFLRFYWEKIGERVENASDRLDGSALHGEIRSLPSDTQIALITLPTPEHVTEAYFIAAVTHPGLDGRIAARYYTLEFGMSVFDNEPYTVLGGWVAGGHINMGDGPDPDLEAFYDTIKSKLAIDP